MTLEQPDDEQLTIPKDSRLHIDLNEYRKLKDEQIARIVMREHLFGGVFSNALYSVGKSLTAVTNTVVCANGYNYLSTY